jgi:hypothetical protein
MTPALDPVPFGNLSGSVISSCGVPILRRARSLGIVRSLPGDGVLGHGFGGKGSPVPVPDVMVWRR